MHTEGEVRLDVPDLEWLSDDPDVNMRNDELRTKVEETCRSWLRQISSALDVLQKKTPQVWLFLGTRKTAVNIRVAAVHLPVFRKSLKHVIC